jgi:hypothetical protein
VEVGEQDGEENAATGANADSSTTIAEQSSSKPQPFSLINDIVPAYHKRSPSSLEMLRGMEVEAKGKLNSLTRLLVCILF